MHNTSPLRIHNRDARRLWLTTQGLATPPTGPLDTLGIIRQLGFVQLDTIRAVSRAHHHIIWNRNQHYREPMLDDLLAAKQTIFEHFTHDASILPLEFYPYWTRQFERLQSWYDKAKNYQKILAHANLDAIMQRVEEEGPLSTHAFDSDIKGKKKMWSRPPHKVGLDYLWYAGELATSHRINFRKFYDLAHRVIDEDHFDHSISDDDQIDWLCMNALDRLGFGSHKEIKEFWDASTRKEVDDWIDGKRDALTKICYQNSDKEWIEVYAPLDIEKRISGLKSLSSQMRIINPFDPAVRDRGRLNTLFGFEYKNEIFVPAAKRKWGYYVYPLLEKDRFVGRIELKADRKKGALNIINFWEEPGVKWGTARKNKLHSELERFARLADLRAINGTSKLR